MTVTVTAEHIRRGRKLNCYSCPVALALKAVDPESMWIVDMGHIHRIQRGHYRGYQAMPPEVLAFVQAFDAGITGLAVEPFVFDLEFAE